MNDSDNELDSERRTLLRFGLSALLAQCVVGKALSAALPAPLTAAEVSIENFSPEGKSLGVPSGHFPVHMTLITPRGCIAASAAIPLCLTRQPNSIPAPAGPVSGNPSLP